MSHRRSTPFPSASARTSARNGKFDGGRAMAVIALGAAVVASFSFEKPFGGVVLALVLAVSAVVATVAVLAALNKQGRRRRSQRNFASVTLDSGRVAMFGAWDNGIDYDTATTAGASDRGESHAARTAHGSHSGL